MEWKKIFANHLFDNGLISRIYKEILQPNSNNKIQFKNEQSTWIDIMTNSVLKKHKHHLADKGPYSQGYGLSSSHVQMWELDHKEGRAPKNWCFRTVVLEKTLQEDPWRSNQSILKEINPEYLLEVLMLKQKLQYFGHVMPTADSLEKTLMLRKTEGRRRRGYRGWDGCMASLIQWTWTWANSRRWWGLGKPGMLQSVGLQSAGHDLATEQ